MIRGVSLGILLVAVAGCSSDGGSTATTPRPVTTVAATTTEPATDETSTSAEGEARPPQTFSGDTTLDPGTYVTSTFQPQVVFLIDTPIYVDDLPCYLYFEHGGDEEQPSWLGVHNSWSGVPVDDVVAQLRSHPDIEIQAQQPAVVAGLPAVLLDGLSLRPSGSVYTTSTGSCEWLVEQGYVWRFYVLALGDQTVVITVEVPLDAPFFLSQADDILGSIEFPQA